MGVGEVVAGGVEGLAGWLADVADLAGAGGGGQRVVDGGFGLAALLSGDAWCGWSGHYFAGFG